MSLSPRESIHPKRCLFFEVRELPPLRFTLQHVWLARRSSAQSPSLMGIYIHMRAGERALFNAVTKRRPDFVPIKIRRMAGQGASIYDFHNMFGIFCPPLPAKSILFPKIGVSFYPLPLLCGRRIWKPPQGRQFGSMVRSLVALLSTASPTIPL